ncbi:uncharacterized protein [Ptychodera flava]|uniref:uncharacterized protein n=1 Tax=Ptychodera flava TaxID=63121 RepID=UPI00396A9605
MSLQDEEHIMISYNWENLQEVMIIKEALEEKGYRIGMELRHEEGSIAWAMTEGVDNSSAVLLCVSKAYKDSVNCNKEASYADSRRKNIVPLKLDETVDLDGWISHMVEGRRCYDFYDFKYFKESVDGLDKELVSLGVQKQGNIYSANVGQHKYIGDPDKILKTKETYKKKT